MMTGIKVFASLYEDISAPYVWLSDRPDMPRPLATLVNRGNRKKVTCQILELDPSFRSRYNAPGRHTRHLPDDLPVTVMNDWYRSRLGVEKGDTLEIEIKPVCRHILWFGQLRGSFSHADHVVRLAADLAIVSVLLGLIGLALGIISLIK